MRSICSCGQSLYHDRPQYIQIICINCEYRIALISKMWIGLDTKLQETDLQKTRYVIICIKI